MRKADQDSLIKIKALQLLYGLGYVVRPEVVLSQKRSEKASRRSAYVDLTDIDVAGYAISPLLQMETVAVDCGSGRGRAAMERVFWTRGVMDAAGISRSLCVVGRATDEEHRSVAHRLNTILLSAPDFDQLTDSLLGQGTRIDFSQYYDQNLRWLDLLSQGHSLLGQALLKDNWAREWERLPVTLPAQLKRFPTSLSPKSDLHRFAFLEIATLLSIGLVIMASSMAAIRPDDFETAVRIYVLGGGKRTQLARSLLRKLDQLEAKGVGDPSLPEIPGAAAFDIPHFSELLDVTSRLANRAGAARFVPRYIQAIQLAALKGEVAAFREMLLAPEDPFVTKLAVDVIRYLRQAGSVEQSMVEFLKDV